MVKVTKSYGLKPFFSGALGCCFGVIGVVLIGGGGPFLLIWINQLIIVLKNIFTIKSMRRRILTTINTKLNTTKNLTNLNQGKVILDL